MASIIRVQKGLRNPVEGARYLLPKLNRLVARTGTFRSSFNAIADDRDPLEAVFWIQQPTSFVEIGVGAGDSLRQFLGAAESAGHSRVRYVGFDTFSDGPPATETAHLEERIEDCVEGSNFWNMHHSSRQAIERITADYAVDCELTLHKGNTRETIPEAIGDIEPVDVIHIDGGHSYETVSNDFRNVRSIIQPGTVVVFDDFNCEPGVTKFASELLMDTDPSFEDVVIAQFGGKCTTCMCLILRY